MVHPDLMADKATCPGCDAHTSSVLRAMEEDSPCPYCGLSAAAMVEIEAVRESRANDDLKEKYRLLMVEHDKLRARCERLADRLGQVMDAVESVDRADLYGP
jgi:hypothetical protein